MSTGSEKSAARSSRKLSKAGGAGELLQIHASSHVEFVSERAVVHDHATVGALHALANETAKLAVIAPYHLPPSPE